MSLFKDGSKIISGLGRIASSPAKGSTWKKNLSPEEKSFLNTHPASNFEAEYQFKERFEKYKKKQSTKNEVDNKKETNKPIKTKAKETVKEEVKKNNDIEKKDYQRKKGFNKFSDNLKNNFFEPARKNMQNSWRNNLSPEEKKYLTSHPGPTFELEITFKERFKLYKEKNSNNAVTEKIISSKEVIQNKELIDTSKVEELKIALEKAKAEEERITLEIANAEKESIALEKAKAEEEKIALEKAKVEEEKIALEKANAEKESIALEKAKAEKEKIALEKAKAEKEKIALEKAKAEEQTKQGINCLKCGTSFSDKDKFCKKCGAKRIINVISQPPVKKEIPTSENKKVLKKDPKEEIPKDKILNLTEELEKLAALKEKGLLTEEEFINAKAKLLN